MKQLALILLLALTSCGGDPLFVRLGWVAPMKLATHQYPVGTKVLLKTGNIGVITRRVKTHYREGNSIPSPQYTVRVGYQTTKNKDWLGETHTISHGEFSIRQFEIEKTLP